MVEIARKSAERFSPARVSHRDRPPSTPGSKPPRFQSNVQSKGYSKKLPIGFISAKDWKLYIHFSFKIRSKAQVQTRGRIQRLLYSFIRLYHEYSYVCDNMIGTMNIDSYNYQKSEQNEKLNNKHYNEINDNERDGFRNIIERLQGRLDESTYGKFQDFSKSNSFQNNCQLKRWFSNKLQYFQPKKSNHTMLYDKIISVQHEAIEIYSSEYMQDNTNHMISFTGFNNLGRPTTKWIQVPIALELLIPKVQSKLEKIMSTCNFLYDPLEVAAELRHFNYNVDRCISHFQKTKKLRDILEHYLPPKSQLKNLEGNPQLWCKFQNFLGKLNNDYEKKINFSDLNRSNSSNMILSKREYGRKKDLSTERFNSPLHSTLIKMVCTIEKLKMTKIDIQDTVSKWKVKFSKQMLEYSIMITNIVKSFKDFLMTTEQKERILHLVIQNDELKIKLKSEESKRKNIYNIMQDQIGNVRVYCRCRTVENQQEILNIKPNDTVVVQLGYCEEYKFDKVFESIQSQSDIYEELKPLVMSFIDGYNVCFITYGGEASGKTYTLLGPVNSNKNNDGVLKRALQDILFEQSSRKRDWEFTVSGSIVEIYNDSFSDLIGGQSGIHLPIDGGLDKVQEALMSIVINDETDIETLIQICKLKRKVGRTALNPHSSRSHLITIVHLAGRSKIHGETLSSYLGMCDLAGFEDILKAQTHNNHSLSKEACYINKSLTAFNRMFTSLRKQDPAAVSYRDTRLTYLLKPFLTNQGKCALIVTVRSDLASISSTQSTLRFGRESRGIALGKTKRQSNLSRIIH